MSQPSEPAATTEPATTGFRAATPWAPPNAVIATIAILLIAIGVAGGVQMLAISLWETIARHAPGGPAHYVTELNGMAVLAVMQAVVVALAWRLAGWHGGSPREVLSLSRPLTRPLFLFGLACMLAVLLPYNLAVYAMWPHDFFKDMQPFAELARSRAAWLAGLVVTIGAPAAEELLFRGFLLPALALAGARMFVGIALGLLLLQILVQVAAPILLGVSLPAPPLVFGMNLLVLIVAALAAFGQRVLAARRADDRSAEQATAGPRSAQPLSFALAALFTTAGWTVMHAYSITGVLEVFLIGLLFCWLIWRTGNLWLTMALHAFYNGAQFLVLSVLPLPAPA